MAPLYLYHIIKAPNLEIQGMVGVVRQYMCVWKSKGITAMLLFTQDRVPDQRQGRVQTHPVLCPACP
ncbi:hypothetical protein PR202_gb25809 [Eleusine coracana subsp. coracana]|uniref:Uncharacterized protein n=1 Tax=Eleusine coracana subsp. coracana TaxID=191504 RepID=A0AAV5FPU0_ELECO|nr:hypothetical protein PR202_gb25773 [Eleusine coracana subsp. coracana]GJN36907.1 hypothetical protein PR202_gb25809 [Eleusine coracana subsp. coracana]